MLPRTILPVLFVRVNSWRNAPVCRSKKASVRYSRIGAAAPIRLYRTDAFFDLQTGAFLQEFTRTNNTGKIVLGNIDPTYTDEFVAGYSRPLPSGWSVELWGMFRETKDIFEDFPSDKSN